MTCGATWTLNHGPLPYQKSSRASDLRRLVVDLLPPSVNVHRRPLAVAAIVTQLVTQALLQPAGRADRLSPG